MFLINFKRSFLICKNGKKKKINHKDPPIAPLTIVDQTEVAPEVNGKNFFLIFKSGYYDLDKIDHALIFPRSFGEQLFRTMKRNDIFQHFLQHC